jgi:hypothetical protein
MVLEVGAEGLEPPTFALKGEEEMQVRALTGGNSVLRNTTEYD